MASTIELEFYETFGIPKEYVMYIDMGDLDYRPIEYRYRNLSALYRMALLGNYDIPESFKEFKKSKLYSEEYPKITDKRILKLLAELNKTVSLTGWETFARGTTVIQLRNEILQACIANAEAMYVGVTKAFRDKEQGDG